MIPTIVNKAGYVITVAVLYSHGRISPAEASTAVPDCPPGPPPRGCSSLKTGALAHQGVTLPAQKRHASCSQWMNPSARGAVSPSAVTAALNQPVTATAIAGKLAPSASASRSGPGSCGRPRWPPTRGSGACGSPWSDPTCGHRAGRRPAVRAPRAARSGTLSARLTLADAVRESQAHVVDQQVGVQLRRSDCAGGDRRVAGREAPRVAERAPDRTELLLPLAIDGAPPGVSGDGVGGASRRMKSRTFRWRSTRRWSSSPRYS